MDMDNLAHVSFGGPSFHHDDPMNALYEAPVPEAEAVDNGQFPVADVVAMPPPAPPPVARVSRGRPNRPNPFPILPNKKNLSIGEEIDLRSLRDAVVAPSAANLEATPFRRRTRRILRKKEVPYQNAEVAFFQVYCLCYDDRCSVQPAVMRSSLVISEGKVVWKVLEEKAGLRLELS